jgi:CubicO group peptidase (beta-lactamase class C family)
MKALKAVVPLMLIFSLSSCLSTRHRSLYPIPGEYRYSVPERMDDGLETGSITPALFDSERMLTLNAFFDKLKRGAFGEIHGVLLVHQGRLVLEEYFPGYEFKGGRKDFTAADAHNLASVTKSITSLCVGIAIDKGFIKGVDQPFLDFYPDVPVPDREAKQGITIRHLLTMTDGLAWDETTHPYTDPRNDVVRLYASPDPLGFILGVKSAMPPGSRWAYNGACPNLLGDVIHRASGLPLDEFAARFLFAPLGITDASWITLGRGFIYASGDARLRPRNMAKIGMLVLDRGVWKGERIVSEGWLEHSMQDAVRADEITRYGFLWWLPILPERVAAGIGPLYMANGWGGQHIVIAPKREMVLVLTGGNYYNQDPNTIPILNQMLAGLFY